MIREIYSDLIIKCQGKEFKVHRAIVCSQIKPLAAAIDHGFEEATTGIFNFEDEEPEIVEYMIKFLYNGSYKTLTKNKEPTTATSAKPNGTLQTEESASAVETLFAVCYAPPSVNTNTTTNGLAQSFAPTTSTADLFDLPRDLFGPTISTGTTTSTTNLFHPFRPSRSLSGPNIAAIPTTSTTSLFVPSEDLFGLKYPATDYSREASSIFDGMPAFDQYPNVELFAEDLINHAKVYIIAEKYDIQPLKIFARDNYSSVSYNHWNSSCFVESIELIFDNTPDIFKGDTLRRTAVEVASKHM